MKATTHRASFLGKLFGCLRWVVLALALAYLFQFIRGGFYKGQSRMGAAFEIIGYEAFRKQYDGLPEMRVIGAGANPQQCSFWNFEELWGSCISVVLHVRDYQPDYHPEHPFIVEREVMRLAEQLRRPCELLLTLKLPNEDQLAHDLECSGGQRSFKLRIWVDSVTVTDERGLPGKPHYWHAANRKHIYTYHSKGAF